MTMPPSGVTGVMDEESVIEAEIQLELENINLDDDVDDVENIDYDADELLDVQDNVDFDIPNELEMYIKTIQEQSSRFEQELNECDELLDHTFVSQGGDNSALLPYDDHSLLVQLARENNLDLEQYKQKIINEIENDEDILGDELSEFLTDDTLPALEQGDGEMLAITGTEEAGPDSGLQEVRLAAQIQQAVEEGVVPEDAPVLQDMLPQDRQMNRQTNAHTEIQRVLREQLDKLEQRYEEKIERIQKDEAFRRNEEEVRQRRVTEERQWKKQELQREEQRLVVEQEMAEREIQKELEEKEKEIQQSMKQFEEEMAVLQRETERQKKEHEQAVEEERNRQKEKQNKSALKIQSTYRAYRVRKELCPALNEKKEERRKKKEEERIKEIEVEIEQRKDEEKKKEEEERLKKEEEKRVKEEEKRQKELEKKQKEEEKKRLKEEEEKKKQEEKRRKEEEKRLKKEEEKRKKEEEKRRKEEEEQRKKEEKRLKDEEEKRKKEEEKKKKEEEKRQKEEEEKRIKEEKRLKEEEEKRRKEEEKRQEEEKKKKEEEEKRKKKEEDEKKKAKDLKVSDGDSEAEVLDKKLESDKSEPVTETVIPKENAKNSSSEDTKESESITKGPVDKPNVMEKSSTKSEEKLKNGIVEDMPVTAKRPKTPRSVRTPRRRDEAKSEKKEPEAIKPVENADILPEHLETLRLKFIKECKPWSKISNEPWKLKAGSSKKPLRRPSSAKKLPLLSENVILQAARVASLQQVTTVQLSDLPGNNMSPLGQCWGLRYLSLTHCHLVVVDSLSQCRQLQYLDVQGNKIEYLDLKDLGNLQYLNASRNRLSSVHGLDSCTNLRWLDLCHNNITKLGGLETLRRLHTLKMSHNQVISTQGLGDTPTLQWVDLAHNHLPALEDLDKLCLLLYLDVSSNNLQQVPQLTNQVLLQELLLSDNSISDLSGLAHTWLPLLQRLDLSQNSLDTLPSLSNCLLLKDLDVGSNQILDTACIHSCVEGCVYLEKLSLEDNPAVEDISNSFYENLRQRCPRLLGPGPHQSPHKPPPVKPGTSFETMCLTQCHVYKDVMQHFDNSLKAFQTGGKTNCDLSSQCDVYFKFCDKTFNIAVEHRYAHEYGEVTVTMPTAPTTPRSGRPSSGRHKEKFMNPKDLFENALKSSNNSHSQSQNDVNITRNNSNSVHVTSHSNPKDLFEQALKASGSASDKNVNFASHGGLTNGHIGAEVRGEKISGSERTKAATKIQAFYRGWSVRRDIEEQTKIWVAVTTIQAAWRGYRVRKIIGPQLVALRNPYRNMDPAVLDVWHRSAVKIQANWRGYILRKKLLAALEYAQYDVEGEEDEDEMMLDAEFDLDKFVDLDEGLLDTDWKPPETPDIPANHPVLKKPPSGRPTVPPLNPSDLRPPSNPRRAWKNLDSPLSDFGRVPRPPSSVASTNLTVRSGASKKEEKLTEEWGFKDTNTAHLMMKRAKKMKYNSEHRKKISKLDPKQRLALFRKLEEVTKPSVYSTPQRKTLPRKEYFQARQDEMERVEQEKKMEFQTRASRTFQWLHTQVGDLPVSDSVINQGTSEGPKYIHESNLPGLQYGKRIQLVSSPGSLDLQSVDSVSSAGHLQKPRRLSANSGGGLTSKLPPIPNNSPPAAHVKERMSFRNPKTNQSVGWGGGKKRGNHL